MAARVARLLVGLVVLVQTPALCACAVDHLLLCGGSHAAHGEPDQKHDAWRSASDCHGHRHEAECGNRETSSSQPRQPSAIGPATLLFVAPPVLTDPAFSPTPHGPPDVAADHSPGASRSVPLLI